MVLAGAAEEEAVDEVAEHDHRQAAGDEREREAAGRARDREADVTAEQVVGAVRHVHHAHEPEREREAAGEQEEQRGERDAVDRLEDGARHRDRWGAALRTRNGTGAAALVLRARPRRSRLGPSGDRYRLYGPIFMNSSGVQVQNCDTAG